jgi:microcystin-dependent protein
VEKYDYDQNSYTGEIRMFAGNYAPAGWKLCQGQLLSIADYDVLFFIIGTAYGGDGQKTFALPDLRGRMPMSFGDSGFLSPRAWAEQGGAETAALTTQSVAVAEQGGVAVVVAAPADGNQLPIVSPYTAINFIICLKGVFPSRD